MHVNLWDPSTAISNDSSGHHLLNNMCDLMQFFVSTINTETHAEHLTKTFIENAVLLFSIVAILVDGAVSQFKNVFKDLCVSLGIIYWPLARGNHKYIFVEKYHCFLNKNQAIAGQYRGTHDVHNQNKKTLSTPGIEPQSTAHIFSEVFLLLVRNSVYHYTSKSSKSSTP